MVDTKSEDQKTFARWLSELDYAKKDEKYRRWLDQSDRIVKRYRDERKSAQSEGLGRRRYNILWSNVETLKGAVYGKMPQPVAERRFLDRDPAARLASLMLERTLAFQMEIGGFNKATKKVVKDRLLPGMGVMWMRYAPEFEAQQVERENDDEDQVESDEPGDQQAEDGAGEVYDKLTFERVCFDYVYYRDFLWSRARCWDEVAWIAKRLWVDKSQAEERFGEDVAKQMIYGDPKNSEGGGYTGVDQLQLGLSHKAEVWEIWSKPDRTVCFIAPLTVGVVLKEESDDPLKLSGFFPCQEPLLATQTNETVVPVPDYVEYQDQAAELDDLTNRISKITAAVRASGVYNSEFPALARLFQDANDNRLIPVDSWAAFAEKGGMDGAISLVPMKDIITVLQTLYEVRDKVKAGIDELTGLSDIIRGVSDPRETKGAQEIKANYASGRLGTRQEEVAEFCRNGLRIAAEIVAEVFSPESLMQMSGVDQMNKEAVQKAVEAVQPPPMPTVQQGQQPDPMMLQARQKAWDEAKRKAAIAKQTELTQQFDDAVKLLRSDKLRGFRVEIETDSTIADALQEDKAAATELVTSTFQALTGAEQTLQYAPELAKPLGGMLMWAFRKYRVGRTLEASLEDALDQIEARLEAIKDQPKQPTPEMLQAQADVQVAAAKAQTEQVKAQAEGARSQADVQLSQAKMQTEQAKMAGEGQAQQLQARIDALTLQLDAQKASNANQVDLIKAKLSFLQATTVAMIAAGQATDAAQLDAKIETILGYGQMQHEATQNELDRQHEAEITASQQAHQQNLQDTAPKPNGAAK